MVGEKGLVFSVLGSGSGGNCVAVRSGGVTVLVDAGLSLKETTARMNSAGLDPASVRAVLLTHEHGDHVSHASTLSRRLGAPLVVNDGTRRAAARFFKGGEGFEALRSGAPFRIGPLEIEAVPKPHDGREPVGFLLSAGGQTLGVFTDIGHVDARVGEALARCTALVFESNHDPAMLAAGPYPPALRARVGGRLGHLSNEDGARALARHATDRLRTVVLAHLSATNNAPELVRQASRRHLGEAPGFERRISYQDRPAPLLGGDGVLASRPAASAAG